MFNPSIETSGEVYINGEKQVVAGREDGKNTYDTQSVYGYTQASLILAIERSANLSLSYNGIFADGLQNHAGFLRVDWVW